VARSSWSKSEKGSRLTIEDRSTPHRPTASEPAIRHPSIPFDAIQRLSLGEEFADQPILVRAVGQEPPDDERDLFRREFLLSNLQRIRLALERDQHRCVHAARGAGTSVFSVGAELERCDGPLSLSRPRELHDQRLEVSSPEPELQKTHEIWSALVPRIRARSYLVM
jgi:hypothetical protein